MQLAEELQAMKSVGNFTNVFLFSVFIIYSHAKSGLVYCMDYLEKNIDWLQSKLEPLLKGSYANSFFLR